MFVKNQSREVLIRLGWGKVADRRDLYRKAQQVIPTSLCRNESWWSRGPTGPRSAMALGDYDKGNPERGSGWRKRRQRTLITPGVVSVVKLAGERGHRVSTVPW